MGMSCQTPQLGGIGLKTLLNSLTWWYREIKILRQNFFKKAFEFIFHTPFFFRELY